MMEVSGVRTSWEAMATNPSLSSFRSLSSATVCCSRSRRLRSCSACSASLSFWDESVLATRRVIGRSSRYRVARPSTRVTRAEELIDLLLDAGVVGVELGDRIGHAAPGALEIQRDVGLEELGESLTLE